MPVWKAKGMEEHVCIAVSYTILLNGRVTAEILAVGVPVAGLVYGFGYLALVTVCPGTCFLKRRSYSCSPGHGGLGGGEGQCGHYPHSAVPHMEITPCLVPVKTDLKSAGARAALANAITLTPGTITVDG